MSGETPPGRFQSLNKKFPGSMSPGPNNHSPNGRGGHNRSRVLTSKVSAPRPINLPSLRREHASDWPTSGNGQGSNTTSSSSTTANTSSNTIGIGLNSTGATSEIKGWGSSPSISQLSSSPKWDDTTTNNQVDTTEWPTTSDNNNSELQSSSPVPKVSSPVPVSSSSPNNSPHPSAATSRAWATVSTSLTTALSGEFPTAAETNTTPTQENNTDTSSTATAMTTNVDKSKTEKKSESRAEKTILNETEHLDWDEIVRQDLENDDPPTPAENETVLPSDRFTEDYDRSYPPQIHPVSDHARPHPSSPSTHNTSYHNNNTRSSPSQQHQQNYHSSSSQSSSSGYYNNNKNNGGYSRRDNNNNSWGNQHHHHNDWNDGHSRNNQERRGSIDRMNNDSNSTAWGGRNRRDSYGSESGGRGRGRGGNRYGNRRPSHDRTSNFQPTSLLQRPRRMSELSQRSDRSASRDETSSVSETIQPATTSSVTLPVVSEQQGQGQQREETLSSSPGHRYTAAQREVMLTTAERAKKRRAEEEAELEASRERARKKAEALAALCESKSKPTAVKSDEDSNRNKSTTETSKTPVASSSLEDSKTATKPENVSKSSVASTDSTSTFIKGSDVNKKPETKDEPSVNEPATKGAKEKVDIATPKQKDSPTKSDAASPKDDGKASTAWTQSPDNPHQLEDEEDNQRWEDYVKGVQSNKSPAEGDNTNDAATSWNNYATRLQTSTEIRMNAAIDRFAAERNIDPSRLNNMRPKDREPLRLHRPQRDNYDNNNNRRGYNNNNRNSDDKFNNRNGDHRHQYRDDGRRDNYSRHKEKEQLTSSSKEHPLNLESWPSLGEGQSTTSNSCKTSMTDQKVSLDNNGEDNSKITTKKKKNSNKNKKDKKVDEEKNAPGKERKNLLGKDKNDDEKKERKQDENDTILAEEKLDELSGKGKEKHNSDDDDKCIDDKENESGPLSVQHTKDEESGVTKKIVVAEENYLTTSTDSTYGLSTKDDDGYEETKEDKEEKKEEQQVQQQFVEEVVDVSHLPREEEQLEDLLPEMIEASETGSFISQNITDTVSTPETEEPCVDRVRTYSAMAVFDHWTRAERHDYLQKSKECIFPDAIERLAELKPTDLTFRTVSDDIRPSSVVEAPSFNDTQSTSSPVLDNNLLGNNNDEYIVNQSHPSLVGPLSNNNGDVQHQPVPYTVSSFDGKISPQFMPPMTMAGRQNFPMLVYQVPYNGQGGPFVPGSPNGTGGYGITTAATDNQQQPMFIPAPMPQQQQFQGQPLPQQQQSQHPSMMNVYLLSPNQMLPPWPGMPPVNNNPTTITTTNNHNHNHNNNQRRRR